MDLTPLQTFIGKVQVAKNYNSKELRLTIQEAEAMSIALSGLLMDQTDLRKKVTELQEQIMNGVEVKQDGGRF